MRKIFSFVACAAFLCTIAGAQTASPTAPAPSAAAAATEATPSTQDVTPASPQVAAPAASQGAAMAPTPGPGPANPAATPPAKTIEVPSGTKVLLSLQSGVNTKTARPGDGVYLSSNFPVIAEGHVVIPAGVYVQGVIDSVVRPGRVKGRAQVTMHFTTMIFPNGSVVSIPGAVNSLPGSAGPTVKGNEGTIEQESSKGKDAGAIATGAATGAGLGGIIGSNSGHPGEGVGYGALGGAVGGVLYTLLTRGNEIMLEQGQSVEMILQRPLMLEEANLSGPEAPGFVPTGQQPRMLPKPSQHPRVLCPVGTIGCQ